VGVWSHFACADEPENPANAMQLDHFTRALDIAEAKGAKLEARHIAASSAALLNPAARFDLIRPGLVAYGLSSAPEVFSARDEGLVPAMTLEADIILSKGVPAGQGVSYGLTYVTDRGTSLGIVPLGYGDGIPRSASDKAPVSVDGRLLHVAGRVCMDQFVVDMGGMASGARAVLFGDPAQGLPSAEDWAQACGTISYEIVTQLGSRVPRVYKGELAASLD
jgi:alanine racemase